VYVCAASLLEDCIGLLREDAVRTFRDVSLQSPLLSTTALREILSGAGTEALEELWSSCQLDTVRCQQLLSPAEVHDKPVRQALLDYHQRHKRPDGKSHAQLALRQHHRC
jgi:hypothetical protein